MKKYVIIGDGQSVHVVKWVHELVKHYNVSVISSTALHDDLHKLLPAGNIFLLNLEIKAGGGNAGILKSVIRVRSILQKINPDFVNAHYITSHGLLAAIIRLIPGNHFVLIQSAWGTDILVTPFISKLYNLATRFSLGKADLITSDSEYMTGVIRGLCKTPVLTFTFGLDKLPDYDPTQKKHGLYFSNRMLSANYNIDEVLRFFARVASTDPDARLVVAHEGDQREVLGEFCHQLNIFDRVQFVGFLTASEQNAMYSKAEFYVSLPTSDSTSVSLLEAMAYGCIPVVSDIPANREWINDGKVGILYSPSLDLNRLYEMRNRQNIIAKQNRKIISEKAIFPDTMKQFSKYLTEHFGNK
jgi:L-malate glycosyltransferase